MTTAPAIDASTVILVRDGEPAGSPWQCFMVRRHVRSEFAGDVFVFPGGKVDNADRDPELAAHCTGHPGPEWSGDRTFWRALRLAAVRELFEEAGVLLAHRYDEDILRLAGEEAARFSHDRQAMQSGELTLLDLARREELIYPLDRLHAISRWITPELFPRRFDTRFFVAYMPLHQDPIHDERETTASEWVAPAVALERCHRGTFPLVFATEKHLERLAGFPSIEALITSCDSSDLSPVMPKMVERDGERQFLLPGDDGY